MRLLYVAFEDIDKNISTMLVLRKITRGNPMKKLFIGFLKWLTNSLEEEQEIVYQPELQQAGEKEPKPKTDVEENKIIVELKEQNKKKSKEPTKVAQC